MLSQSSLRSYHKIQIDPERLAPAVQSDKFGQLLRKVLPFNKSSTKSYEYMKLVIQKESYHKNGGNIRNKPGNLVIRPILLLVTDLKAKCFIDAIDACHGILAKYPNIRREILYNSREDMKK